MKSKRKVLSLLLALCLVAGLIPTLALAAVTDTGKAIQLVDSGTAANIGGKQADNIYFGTYEQSSDGSGGYNLDPIKWRVLSNANDQLFLLSDQNLDVFQYHTENEDVTWETSTMRSWLNGYDAAQNYGGSNGIDYTNDNFLDDAFSDKEQTAIAQTEVVNNDNKDEDYGTNGDGGNNTTDKIFLLSINDTDNIREYFPKFSTSRFSTNTEYVAAGGKLGSYMYEAGEGDRWWLRSPGFDNSMAAFIEEDGGGVYEGNPVNNKTAAVRPAFNLNLNSVLFTSAASGGKDSGTVGTLSTVSDYAGNEWKLTLLDAGRSDFAVNVNGQKSVSASAGGSVQIAYSGAQTGTNEYVSVLLCDSNGNVLYYGNIAQNSASGTAALNIPAGLAVGNYTLKVFSEQCNGDYKTDYASAFQDISLNVLAKETAPQAVFTATGDNGGTLSNVESGMKYSVDGGASWNDITDTTMDITGVTADKDIQVVKKGNGTTTADSEAQIIDVTQAATPAEIGTTDCTTTAQNDGTITNVDNTMEYRLSTASDWTEITDTEVTGLVNGTYEVRVRANGTVLASDAATVIIGEHVCAAQSDWKYDENNHWQLCACGAEVGKDAHTGGTATCTEKAVCEVCGEKYGEINASNHTNLVKTEAKDPTCTEEGNIEYWTCKTCDKYFSDAEGKTEIELADTVIEAAGHDYEDGKCTVCGTEDPDYEAPAPFSPEIIAGANSTWQKGTKIGLSFTSNAEFDDFLKVQVDGKDLDASNYTVKEGSTIVTLKAEYLGTLSAGTHTLAIVSETGTAETEFTIKAAPASDDTQSPQTGDNSNMMLWIALLFVSGGALFTMLFINKKKSVNNR